MNSFGYVQEPYYREIHIVAGGPSLKDFDFSKLKGKVTIGVNNAAFKARTDICFSLDSNWIKQSWEKFKDFNGEVYISCPKNILKDKLPENTIMLKRNTNGIISFQNDTICGRESGYGSIGLAILKGAKEIYIHGLDLDSKYKQRNWHEGYSWSRGNRVNFDSWIPRYNDLANEIKKTGIKIFNCNPDSKVEAFNYVNF